MKRVLTLLAAMLLLGVTVGCGGDDEPSDQAAATPSASPFDRAFIDAMVPHHRSAIEMAEAAKSRGLRSMELKQIADDIISSQQQEIDKMLAWREQWFGSRTLGRNAAEVLGLSESQMGMMEHDADEISGAVDVDQAFAQAMSPHHEGAITMAKLAQERGQHEEIKTLADDIIEAQEGEIKILQKHTGGEHHG